MKILGEEYERQVPLDFRFRTLEDELMGDPRTCRNCACVYLIERPAIMPKDMNPREFDSMPKEQWVCRFNPPFVVNTPKGPALMQGPTNPDSVCWHWVPEGFLPGERLTDRYAPQPKE